MTSTPCKRSTLEQRLDYYILVIFTLLACLCIVDAVGASQWVDKASLLTLQTETPLDNLPPNLNDIKNQLHQIFSVRVLNVRDQT